MVSNRKNWTCSTSWIRASDCESVTNWICFVCCNYELQFNNAYASLTMLTFIRCCFSFSSSHTPSQSNATVIRLHNRWRVLSTIKTSTTSIQRAEKMKRKKVTKWQACSVCCAQQLQCDRDWRCRPKARRESIVSRWYSSKSNVASHANRDCLCEATGAFAHTQFNEPFCNSNNNHTIRNLNVVVFVSSRFHLSGVVARLRCVAWWLSLFLSPSVCVCFGYCIRFPFKCFFVCEMLHRSRAHCSRSTILLELLPVSNDN